MFAYGVFFDDENIRRTCFGLLAAIIIHAITFAWFSYGSSQKIISADTFSLPTNVSIRFISPVEEVVKPTIEFIKPKPIKKKIAEKTPEQLNKIEPAVSPQNQEIFQSAQTQPVRTTKPVSDIIPIVSERHLKGKRIQPEYPKRSLRLGQEGVVLLHVLISEEGTRQDIKLYKPSQYALLNQAAIKAVKKWTFDPNTVNGRAVQSWVEIPIEFKIQ